MDTPFERLEDEVKRDWNNHPVTQLYLRTLEGYRAQLGSEILLRSQSNGDTPDVEAINLKLLGGQRLGLSFAVDLAGGVDGR